jgi:hypothetical protein
MRKVDARIPLQNLCVPSIQYSNVILLRTLTTSKPINSKTSQSTPHEQYPSVATSTSARGVGVNSRSDSIGSSSGICGNRGTSGSTGGFFSVGQVRLLCPSNRHTEHWTTRFGLTAGAHRRATLHVRMLCPKTPQFRQAYVILVCRFVCASCMCLFCMWICMYPIFTMMMIVDSASNQICKLLRKILLSKKSFSKSR